MTIVELIITSAAVIGALGTIGGVFYGVHKVLKRFDNLEAEGKNRKGENKLIIKSIFCLCDGLQQLGANGKVSECKNELLNHAIDH